jgi:formate--tetrahydrofolate ligase
VKVKMKKIVIIGGGIAGLCAGIYGQKAGYQCEIYEKNAAAGGTEVAKEVLRLIEEEGNKEFQFAYDENLPIKEKIRAISQKIYGADDVIFTDQASKEIAELEKNGFGGTPVCMAKTQYSLTDDQTKLGRPEKFNITVRQVAVSAGAGFVVAITGSIMKMPGLPKVPAAERIDVDNTGKISGLF